MDRTGQHRDHSRSRRNTQSGDVKIQIDGCSRTSSSNQNRGTSSDGTETTEVIWSREVKEPKKTIFHTKQAKRGMKEPVKFAIPNVFFVLHFILFLHAFLMLCLPFYPHPL
jgi:hypothetical protein